MSEFEDRLWREILRRHEADLASAAPPVAKPRRRPLRRVIGGGLLALGAVGFVLALTLIPPAVAGSSHSALPAGGGVGNSGALMEDTGAPPTPDLAITKTAPASAVRFRTLTYKITATNTGDATADSVVVTDPLPASVLFIWLSTSQGTCSRPPIVGPKRTVTCKVGNLTAGGSVRITIEVITTKQGTLANTATVTATNVTPDADDSSTATTTVRGR